MKMCMEAFKMNVLDLLKVMIIDDSESVLSVAGELFAQAGCKFLTIEKDPKKAIDLILQSMKSENSYNLVVTDINMPVIDGFEILKLLSENHYKGSVSIFSELDERIVKSIEHFALYKNLFLTSNIPKPITFSAIQSTIDKACIHLKDKLKHAKSAEIKFKQHEIKEMLYTQGVIVPYYQPVYDLNENKVVSIEALARVNTDSMGPVTAAPYIPLIKEYGYSSALLNIMLRQVISDIQSINEIFGESVSISINILPEDLMDENLPKKIERVLELKKQSPRRLVFEIPDGLKIDNDKQLESLSRLKMLGIELILDDYGSGNTSIIMLESLPYNQIKLDRHIIHDITTEQLPNIIVDSIFNILKGIDVQLIAKGVESQEASGKIKAISNGILQQGYAHSEACSLESFCNKYNYEKKSC